MKHMTTLFLSSAMIAQGMTLYSMAFLTARLPMQHTSTCQIRTVHTKVPIHTTEKIRQCGPHFCKEDYERLIERAQKPHANQYTEALDCAYALQLEAYRNRLNKDPQLIAERNTLFHEFIAELESRKKPTS